MIDTISFSNDPNIGLYAFATDEYCLTGEIKKKELDKLEKCLNVKVIKSRISGTSLIGIFSAGNSKGIIVPEIITPKELDLLNSSTNVLVLDGVYNAIGNLVLANDKGCLISEKLENHKETIQDFLGVTTKTSTISELDLVGTYAIANSKGCAVAKTISESEEKTIQDILKVNPGRVTVNFSYSFVKSGIIVNTEGLLVGSKTSGPELERITSALGF